MCDTDQQWFNLTIISNASAPWSVQHGVSETAGHSSSWPASGSSDDCGHYTCRWWESLTALSDQSFPVWVKGQKHKCQEPQQLWIHWCSEKHTDLTKTALCSIYTVQSMYIFCIHIIPWWPTTFAQNEQYTTELSEWITVFQITMTWSFISSTI